MSADITPPTLSRRVAAEALGTALLLAIVVGSGISGERYAGGSVGLALLANTLATGAGLVVLILTLGPISGAHLNPAVTLVEASRGSLPQRDAFAYVAAQIIGAFAGVALAHAMFDLPLYAASAHARTGTGQLLSEGVATFGLVFAILAVSRARPAAVPATVGLYITAAYWFTASASFANPAVTFARALTPTFAGIRAGDVPGFVVAQLAGACAALGAFAWLWPEERTRAAQPSTAVVVSMAQAGE